MSIGCCVVASNTPPVKEVIQDGINGLLVDFFDINQLLDKVYFVLDNKQELNHIRHNARQTVIDKYDLKKLLPKHINIIKTLAINHKTMQYID